MAWPSGHRGCMRVVVRLCSGSSRPVIICRYRKGFPQSGKGWPVRCRCQHYLFFKPVATVAMPPTRLAMLEPLLRMFGCLFHSGAVSADLWWESKQKFYKPRTGKMEYGTAAALVLPDHSVRIHHCCMLHSCQGYCLTPKSLDHIVCCQRNRPHAQTSKR